MTAKTGEAHKRYPFSTYAHSDMSDVCLQITFRGRVSPVGKIKEKVVGCALYRRQQVILPWANRKGVEHNVPKEVRQRTRFVIARAVREVPDSGFSPGSMLWLADAQPLFESRFQETGESPRFVSFLFGLVRSISKRSDGMVWR